jgi:hypothetical protein
MSVKKSVEPIGGHSFNGPAPYTTESINLVALGATTDEGRNFILNFAQFLYAEHSVNPATTGKQDTPPERLLIHFTVGEVIILGSNLHRLAVAVQKAELQSIAPARDDNSKGSSVVVSSVVVNIYENGRQS